MIKTPSLQAGEGVFSWYNRNIFHGGLFMLIPYRSVRTPCRKETEIKKSIFIAQLFPVETEEEAQSILETVRKNHKDAAHHCWAWRIGTIRIREKSSDGGEPQGTAGHPMLHVLQMKSLTNKILRRHQTGDGRTGESIRRYSGGSRGGSRYSLFYAPRPPGTYDSLYRGRHV